MSLAAIKIIFKKNITKYFGVVWTARQLFFLSETFAGMHFITCFSAACYSGVLWQAGMSFFAFGMASLFEGGKTALQC